MAKDLSVLALCVTLEQREVIYAMFQHNGWHVNELDATDSAAESSSNSDGNDTYEEYRIAQNPHMDICTYCLCQPCITDVSNKQLWWEEMPTQPAVANSKKRKEHYKRFWTGLLHRGVWENPIYVQRKEAMLADVVQRPNIVLCGPRGGYHPRDIMPKCVLELVRTWLPNPPSQPYMGHKWN